MVLFRYVVPPLVLFCGLCALYLRERVPKYRVAVYTLGFASLGAFGVWCILDMSLNAGFLCALVPIVLFSILAIRKKDRLLIITIAILAIVHVFPFIGLLFDF